jgi:inorganic pyrophosphatase
MRSALTALPTWRKDGSVNAVIEAPRGCGVKITYDPEGDCFEYGKALPLGMTYPYCFGFIPGTEGEDGDPLDVLVLTDAPTFPGVVVPARLIGIVRLSENGKTGKRHRNDRLVGVPTAEPRIADGVGSPEDLCDRLREEIEQFFLNTTLFTQKEPRIEGWKGPTAAQKLIRRSTGQR